MATAVLVALGALLLALLCLAVRQGAQPGARKALAQVDRHALDVAVNNASVLSSFTRVVAGARTQSAVLASLREGVQALAQSVDTVAEAAATTCGEVDSMHALTLRGDALLQETLQRIASLEQSANGLEARFREVRQHTGDIEGIVAMIQNVAMQTHLLSLNAAVEAARAGEQGRGFAVVADEVRKLAERVNKATAEIAGNINGVITLVENTRSENDEINADVLQTREVVSRSAEQFQRMVGDFEGTSEKLLQIAAAMEELSATNEQVHENVDGIHRLSGSVAQHMEESEQRTLELAQATEAVQELVSRFKIGAGAFDQAVDRTRRFRDDLQAELEAMAKRGINIFDRSYQPIPDTNPQKYKVSWGDTYAQTCQGLLESCLKDIPGCAFAVGMTSDSYLSAHNLKYSKPLTGDYETDLVGNRVCRKFERPSELRSAANTEPMLLQTYQRDTGEVLCDIAMPIYVGGRHWGNVRVGVPADALLAM